MVLHLPQQIVGLWAGILTGEHLRQQAVLKIEVARHGAITPERFQFFKGQVGEGHGSFAVEIIIEAGGWGLPPCCATSEIDHHGIHLIGVDCYAVPCHAVTGLPEVATDLPLHHAADELIPRGLAVATVLDTRLSGVVEELIVANPQGSIPGLVGCPTVVGRKGEVVGHESFRFDGISLQGRPLSGGR
jgi:hypothetical protein